MQPQRCRKTRTYRSEVDAKIALANCRAAHREERSYHWCAEHHGYHLTSMVQNVGGRVIA